MKLNLQALVILGCTLGAPAAYAAICDCDTLQTQQGFNLTIDNEGAFVIGKIKIIRPDASTYMTITNNLPSAGKSNT